MEQSSGETPKRPWPRRIIKFVVGFAISLVVGAAFAPLTEKGGLQAFTDAQDGWIRAVSNLSPFSVIGSFADHTAAAWRGAPLNPDVYDLGGGGGAGVFSPFFGLLGVVQTAFESDQFFVLITLGLGAAAVAAFNKSRSKGRTIFLEDAGVLNFVVLPAAVIGATSVIALVMQGIMWGALQALHGLTGLAVGLTGFAYGCYYCGVKLGEKGVETVLTSKLK